MTNRILIINSSLEILQAVCHLLSLEGYYVFEATYNQDLQAEIQRIQPNLVILDYVPQFKPRFLDVFNHLRTQEQEIIPIIVTTVLFDLPASVRMHLQAQDPQVLVKPFGSGDLLKAIRAKLPMTSGANTYDVG